MIHTPCQYNTVFCLLFVFDTSLLDQHYNIVEKRYRCIFSISRSNGVIAFSCGRCFC